MDHLRSARVRWKLLMERRGHRSVRTCPTCGGSLSVEWPHLDPTILQEHKHNLKDWKAGKSAGCDFCSVVTLVIRHAIAQHRLEPHPNDVYQRHASYNERDIEVSWGKKFNQLVLTVGDFSDKVEEWSHVLTVHPQKENILLKTQDSKLLDRSSQEAMALIQWWMAICEKEHTSCKRTSTGFMPRRLLKLTDDMVNLQLDLDAMKPYVALSHCWGPTKPVMLLETDIQAFQHGISWTDLPRTFAEAITLTRKLGYEFIWIDTMCIIQDSDSDWQEQSSLMASIYGNAALVLAASSSGSSEDGFLLLPDGESLSHGPEPYPDGRLHLNRKVRSKRVSDSLKVHLEPTLNHRGPLDDRAWAYQEEVIANRYLSFGSREMMWACTEAVYFESGRGVPRRSEKFGKPNLTNLFASITKPQSLLAYWRDMVINTYSQKRLTHQSDVLVALSAIAQAFHSRMNSTYLAGLWKEDLIRGLCWYCPVESVPRQNYCPTWTWASVDSLYTTYSRGSTESNEESNLCAAVVEADASPATINIYGPVSKGMIVVSGPSVMATLELDTIGQVLEVASEKLNEVRLKFGQEQPTWEMEQDTPLVKTSVTLPDGTRETSARRTAFGETIQAQKELQVPENQTTNAWLLILRIGENGVWRTLEILVLGRDEMNPDRFHRLGLLIRPVGILGEVGTEMLDEVISKEMECGEFSII